MKKHILFILIFFITSLVAYSQNNTDFYAYIKQDFATSSGKSYYSGSLLPLDVKFKVLKYDKTKAGQDYTKDHNDGIDKAADNKVVFSVLSFDEKTPSDTINPKDVVPQKVRYKAGEHTRYDVKGVTESSVRYLINGEEIDSIQCFLIVPKTLVQNVVEAWEKIILLESVIDIDSTMLYMRVNIEEIYDSARYALVYGEERSQYCSMNDSIELHKNNNIGPSSISFAFSDINNMVFIPDFLLKIEEFHRKEGSIGETEEGWCERNDFWVNPLGTLLLCAIVIIIIYRQKEKNNDIEQKHAKETREKIIKVIKNMPNSYLEKWNDVSIEKRAEILRSSTDKVFNEADDYVDFWGKVDYEKDATKNDCNDDLAMVIAAFYSSKEIQSIDKQKGDILKNKEKNINDVSILSDEVVSKIERFLETKSSDILDKINKTSEPINKQIGGLEQSVSDIKTQVSNNKKIDQIHQSLEELKKSVQNINSLVSKTDDKKEIDKLKSQLDEKTTAENKLKESLDLAKATIIERETTIKKLNGSVESLEKQLIIPDSVEVKGLGHFIVFAQHLLNYISDAETKLIRDWMSISDTEVKGRASYFIANELATRPTKEIERWTSILATLKTKSVITDPELVKYIKIVDEKERLAYVNKQFVESVVVSAVSSVLVLLEQFRTGNEWGHVVADSESYATCIKNIIALCKNEDINVNYCKLYEKLSDYGNVEIEVTVPAPVCDWIDTNRKDIVLYVKKYSVSSKLLNHVEKTSCVVAI